MSDAHVHNSCVLVGIVIAGISFSFAVRILSFVVGYRRGKYRRDKKETAGLKNPTLKQDNVQIYEEINDKQLTEINMKSNLAYEPIKNCFRLCI